MESSEILKWLREANPNRLELLWLEADTVRQRAVGDQVHLRGLIEIGNFCVRNCAYCGIRRGNKGLDRYRLSAGEIIDAARLAARFGYGTVVMQSGEDYGIEREWLAGVIEAIKRETQLAVTLSVGERPEEDLRAWREAGADRYLLRFETSDPTLYSKIHPALPAQKGSRIDTLRTLKSIGYESGSGVMIGLPGQSYESLVGDIERFRTMDLDMIGVGPYLPHPGTPLGTDSGSLQLPEGQQVPNSELMAYKVVALTRLICPGANIPSTTALATVNSRDGRTLGLQRGANVVMPNVTPLKYRRKYEIYPNKAGLTEDPVEHDGLIKGNIAMIGRKVGKGRGDRMSCCRLPGRLQE